MSDFVRYLVYCMWESHLWLLFAYSLTTINVIIIIQVLYFLFLNMIIVIVFLYVFRHRKGRIGVRSCISMDYYFNSFKINLHCYKLKDFLCL